MVLPNSPNCREHKGFVSTTLEEWITCRAVRVLGKVRELDPLCVVMPLTMEPTKPRLCHDKCYLNLWVKDLPFTLDTLREVPCVVGRGEYMTLVDHKSGYQHKKLAPGSEQYFRILWKAITWYT